MTASVPPSLNFCLLDYPVAIAAAEPEGREALQSVLGSFVDDPTSGERNRYELVRDEHGWHVTARGAQTARGLTLTDALKALEGQLVSDMLGSRPDRFYMHGAALLAPSGDSSVLILGDSGSGKTTLTLVLMARGFLPFADDVIVMDEDWSPVAFRRAFHVNDSTRTLLDTMRVAPGWDFDEWPAGYFVPRRWAESRAPVRTILFPTLRPGSSPEATPLSIPEAAARLLPFSGTLDRAPKVALGAASQLTAQARCYALTSSDLDATADLIVSLL
jgi:hypothetical protein